MVEVDAAGSSAGGRCGMVRWRLAERVRLAGERRGGSKSSVGSQPPHRQQQSWVSQAARRGWRHNSDADGGLTAVCWSKWPRSFSVLGAKTVFFSVLRQKPRLSSVLRPILQKKKNQLSTPKRIHQSQLILNMVRKLLTKK